jgi:hypothetical protein
MPGLQHLIHTLFLMPLVVLQAKNDSRASSVALDLDRFSSVLQQQLSKPATAQELVDALHFAASLSDTRRVRTAFTAVLKSERFRSLDIQLSLEAVQRLMCTATARCLVEVLAFAANQPAAAQIPAAAMDSMIRTVLHSMVASSTLGHLHHVVDIDRANEVLQFLCKAAARATQQLTDGAALALYQTALQLSQLSRLSTRAYMMRIILSIPAVKQLDAHAVEQVLLPALTASRCSRLTLDSSSLCQVTALPAAQQLSAAAVQRLLKAAVRYGDAAVARSLTALPAERELEAAAVLDVLQLAVTTHNAAANAVILRLTNTSALPAAEQLGSDTLVQLVEATAAAAAGNSAAALRSMDTVKLVLRLPCLQQVTVEQLQRLVMAAREISKSLSWATAGAMPLVVEQLLRPAAAEQLPADAVAALLAMALVYNVQVSKLCTLSGAAQMTAQQLQPILMTAMRWLCKPATGAGQVSATADTGPWSGVQQRIPDAAPHSSTFQLLCALPGAHDLGVQQLTELFQAACSSTPRQAGWQALVTTLCKLPAAQGLGSEVVGSLLCMSLQLECLDAVQTLCSLLEASLTVDEAQSLLWQLLQLACEKECTIDDQLYQPIFGLAAAQQLGQDTFEEMLHYLLLHDQLRIVSLVCGLPAAAHIDGERVAELLQQAVRCELAGKTEGLRESSSSSSSSSCYPIKP